MSPRRHAGASRARHGDDWLITYADTITLLLCVFVVLLALRGTGPHIAGIAEQPRVVSPAPRVPAFPPPPIVAPLREAEVMPRDSDSAEAEADARARDSDAAVTGEIADQRPAGSPLPGFGETAHRAAAMPDAHAAGRADGGEDRDPVPAPVAARRPDAGPDRGAPAAGAEGVLGDPGQMVRSAASGVRAPRDAGAADRTGAAAPAAPRAGSGEPPGDRITIFQCSDTAFFGSGSAALSDAGATILTKLLGTLLAPRFAGYRITVEGHTDDAPISSTLFPSNWELSSARAASVVRFLVEHGIPARRLRAAGYADTRPLAPNRDAAGRPIPENQAKNRRVAVVLERIDHESAAGGQ